MKFFLTVCCNTPNPTNKAIDDGYPDNKDNLINPGFWQQLIIKTIIKSPNWVTGKEKILYMRTELNQSKLLKGRIDVKVIFIRVIGCVFKAYQPL